MGVDHKVAVLAQQIALRVDAFFAGGLDVAVIAEVVHAHQHDVVRRQRFIGFAAGRDNEGLLVDPTAHVAPGTRDQARFHELFARGDHDFFCLQNIHTRSFLSRQKGQVCACPQDGFYSPICTHLEKMRSKRESASSIISSV